MKNSALSWGLGFLLGLLPLLITRAYARMFASAPHQPPLTAFHYKVDEQISAPAGLNWLGLCGPNRLLAASIHEQSSDSLTCYKLDNYWSAEAWKHEGGLRQISLSGDGNLVAAPYGDQTVYRSSDGTVAFKIAPKTFALDFLTLSKDARTILSGTQRELDVYSIGPDGTSTRVTSVKLGMSDCNQVKVSPEDRWIAVGGSQVEIYEMGSWRCQARLPLASVDLHFADQAPRLAVSRGDGQAAVYDVNWHELLCTVRHGDKPVCVALSPDGRLLATTDSEQTKVWDVESGQLLDTTTLPGHGTCMDWAYDTLAVGCENGAIVRHRVSP